MAYPGTACCRHRRPRCRRKKPNPPSRSGEVKRRLRQVSGRAVRRIPFGAQQGEQVAVAPFAAHPEILPQQARSEEHTSELQSLMRISYAVFCLKKKKTNQSTHYIQTLYIQNNVNNTYKEYI